MNIFRLVLLAVLLFVNASAFAATASQVTTIEADQAPKLVTGSIIHDCTACPEMVIVPDGSFDMGSNNVSYKNEQPVHRVTISRPFAIGKTEITQGQWKAIMGSNPSHFPGCGDNCPVEQVSWDDAQEFIKKLNAMTGNQYRLPSEAEWEYACRANGNQEYCGSDNINSVAWYGTFTDGETTHPASTKQANAFGLFDMSGNVWEWVEDIYHDNYKGAPSDGSAWQGNDIRHVLRGGSWNGKPQAERAFGRVRSISSTRIKSCGFRIARTLS